MIFKYIYKTYKGKLLTIKRLIADRFLDSLTVCSYPKVAISKHFNVNQAETLIEAQSLI
jgi:hypothetical protein